MIIFYFDGSDGSNLFFSSLVLAVNKIIVVCTALNTFLSLSLSPTFFFFFGDYAETESAIILSFRKSIIFFHTSPGLESSTILKS